MPCDIKTSKNLTMEIMPKYTKYDILSYEFQFLFFPLIRTAPIIEAASMLEKTANIFKERGSLAQCDVLDSLGVNRLRHLTHDITHDITHETLPPLVIKALDFATKAHNFQLRNHTSLVIPYVIHLYDVAAKMIQWNITDEATLAAGILHDTVEDTNVTLHDIESKFGREVAAIVNQVSEGDCQPGATKPPKQERKLNYVAKIKTAPLPISPKVLIVSAIDKISNAWDYINAAEMGDHLSDEDKELQLKFYNELIPVYFQHIGEEYVELRHQVSIIEKRLASIWA